MKFSSLAVALKHFFGFLPNQTATGFAAEVRQLTDADRTEFRVLLTAAGYEIGG